MMYFKSQYSDMMYKDTVLPKFGGWDVATEEEWIEWCKARNIEP